MRFERKERNTEMLNYRAVLTGVPGLERPRQTFGQCPSEINRWAKTEIAGYPPEKWPEAGVEVYRVEERLIETVRYTATAPK